MNLAQFFLILKARWLIALAVVVTVASITLVASLLWPAQFTASSLVLVDVRTPDPVGGGSALPGNMPTYMPTQIDIIYSDRVALKVVKSLKLDQHETVKQQWLEATGGRGKLENWLADTLQKGLEAKPSRDSNVITIGYTSADPGFSAAIANAFAQAYVETNVDLRTDPARQYAQWFQGQGKALRDNLEKVQARLSDYQQQKGIVVTDERLDSETAKLSELTTQLTFAQAETGAFQSKQNAGGQSESMTDVMLNPLVQNLKSQIASGEARLQDVTTNLGANHPTVKRMESELASLRQRLASEVRNVTTSFGTSRNVGRDKEAILRGLIAGQKQKLLQLKSERDEAFVLLRDVDAAQKAYDAVSQRFTQTSLESQTTQTNIAMLTPAVEPLSPSAPRPLLYTLIASFVGLLLGVCAAFLREMMDRRVRSTDDLELALEVPVLATLSRQKALGRRPLLLGRSRALNPPPAYAS